MPLLDSAPNNNSYQIVLERRKEGLTANDCLRNILKAMEKDTITNIKEEQTADNRNKVIGGFQNIYICPIDDKGNIDITNRTTVPIPDPDEEDVPLEDMSAKERFAFFLDNTGCDELIVAFVDYVNETAIELMRKDGKVEGKHYAAMKLVLKEAGIEHNLK